MLKEVEDKIEKGALHDSCEGLAYCPKYSHLISDKYRWYLCHTSNHLNCDYRNLLEKLELV